MPRFTLRKYWISLRTAFHPYTSHTPSSHTSCAIAVTMYTTTKYPKTNKNVYTSNSGDFDTNTATSPCPSYPHRTPTALSANTFTSSFRSISASTTLTLVHTRFSSASSAPTTAASFFSSSTLRGAARSTFSQWAITVGSTPRAPVNTCFSHSHHSLTSPAFSRPNMNFASASATNRTLRTSTAASDGAKKDPVK